MSDSSLIPRIQDSLRKSGASAWLFYGFSRSRSHRHPDTRLRARLSLHSALVLSGCRPKATPHKMVHRIEAGNLDHLPGEKTIYLTWRQLEDGLRDLLRDHSRGQDAVLPSSGHLPRRRGNHRFGQVLRRRRPFQRESGPGIRIGLDRAADRGPSGRGADADQDGRRRLRLGRRESPFGPQGRRDGRAGIHPRSFSIRRVRHRFAAHRGRGLACGRSPPLRIARERARDQTRLLSSYRSVGQTRRAGKRFSPTSPGQATWGADLRRRFSRSSTS